MQDSPHAPASPQAVLPSLGAPHGINQVILYAMPAKSVQQTPSESFHAP